MSIIGKFLKIAGKDPNGNAKGVAVTENGEVRIKADELEGLLEEIRDKDFATDTKLELVRALLESINSKDYSTEVTLQAVLTELANLSNGTKAMKVQQTGRNVPLESLIFERKGELPPATNEVLLDIPNKPCHLERLALASNNETIGINIFAYDKDGNLSPRLGIPVTVAGTGTTDILTVSVSVLQNYWNGENDFFKVFLYDNNNRYTLGMKKQIVFNNGLRITVTNYTQVVYNVAVNCLVSTWEG